MRRVTLLLTWLISLPFAYSQEETNGYLFSRFTKGTVFLKNGTVVQSLFNYYVITEEMLFQEPDGKILAIANPSDVGSVVIDERRFINPGGLKFYEVIEVDSSGNSLFVQWKSKMISQGKAAGYGGYSQTTSVTSYGTLKGDGEYKQLAIDEKFKAIPANSYYLRINNKYKSFNNAGSLAKLFKGQESAIENYAKENEIDFDKTEDIIRIVKFCFRK